MKFSQYDRIVCLIIDKRYHKEKDRIINLVGERGGDVEKVEIFVDGKGELLPPNRYDQISSIPPKHWRGTQGAYAHFCAMTKVVAKAKRDGVENLLWLEDDVILMEDFDEIVEKVVNEAPEWDLLYYGANHTWANTVEVSPHLLRCYGSLTTHCMGISHRLFDGILSLSSHVVIDQAISLYLHHTYRCYAIWPSVALQKPGYSHISNIQSDYIHYFSNKGMNHKK